MQIKLIVIGKTSKSYFVEAEQEYLKRLKKYAKVSVEVIPYIKNAKNLSEIELKLKEGKEILKRVSTGDVYLLDERGKHYSSKEFAKFLQQKMNHGTRQLNIIIGGAYGFSDEVYQKSVGKISLSKMTFNHQMIRMFALEQVYRGFSILNGEPYHNE